MNSTPSPNVSSSPSTVPVAMIGFGTVGRGVARLLHDHAAAYEQRFSARPVLTAVLVRDLPKAQAAARESGMIDPILLTDDAEAFFAIEAAVVIEVAGGVDQAGAMVRRALEAKRHVVTANKALLASRGAELCGLAHANGVSLALEASCGGGIPCVTALTQGLLSNRIRGLYGILNGTCNFILSEMTEHGASYDAALKQAQELGYAEADPTLDVSGMDAGQKLVVLAGLAFGVQADDTQLTCTGIDDLARADIEAGGALGYDIKLLAIAEQSDDGRVSLSVEPCFVREDALITEVCGPFNALSVVGDAAGHVLLYGQGAGQLPTASAIVADLLQIVTGAYPAAFAAAGFTPDRCPPVRLLPAEEVEARYYVRLEASDDPGVLGKICSVLGDLGIGISAVSQPEEYPDMAPGLIPVVLLTDAAPRGKFDEALSTLASMDTINGTPRRIRIVDLP